ncbi:hypothetical protein Goshw_019943 [Gossypium schwendimanii]|uniref:Uncharacterized protein n=1 Tax=Gossypium schwendimanii TaxID=34291 RepID=A0A7J9L4J5_GOSSC|nr:hypothetical protein [Gossypium schwendimanii]
MENVFHLFLPLSTFTQYTENANAGNGQSFSNCGKNGNDVPNDLNNYRKGAYVVGSSFSSYGEAANVSQAIAINPMWVTILSNLTLKIPMERKSIFQTTANLSMKEPINSQGRAKEQWANPLGSKSMEETTLLRIIQKRASFSVDTTMAVPLKLLKASGSVVNKWVEPGKFFREKLFKRGTVMPILEIRDKMPSASERGARRDQAVCGVGGGHDRFATSVLGPNVEVGSMENVKGSKQNIKTGSVRGIKGSFLPLEFVPVFALMLPNLLIMWKMKEIRVKHFPTWHAQSSFP